MEDPRTRTVTVGVKASPKEWSSGGFIYPIWSLQQVVRGWNTGESIAAFPTLWWGRCNALGHVLLGNLALFHLCGCLFYTYNLPWHKVKKGSGLFASVWCGLCCWPNKSYPWEQDPPSGCFLGGKYHNLLLLFRHNVNSTLTTCHNTTTTPARDINYLAKSAVASFKSLKGKIFLHKSAHQYNNPLMVGGEVAEVGIQSLAWMHRKMNLKWLIYLLSSSHLDIIWINNFPVWRSHIKIPPPAVRWSLANLSHMSGVQSTSSEANDHTMCIFLIPFCSFHNSVPVQTAFL